ncbi:rhomboid family intramembrane serine protease [Salinarimonas soli]|uniref:Rhomboid family intramembrane serine protease n=1 Tax=Salinarimonas soli TaxID=1638099 RepID=A0A5B2VT58_9HYPH|nr:rhomboid family intramembrane serine protease [Salinarimonas soli]KAA2242195.1 rhomboid family intramembrane serine protease [Salinarimonas soli]
MSERPYSPGREPMFNLPGVVILTAGLLAAIHVGRGLLSPETDFRLLLELAFVPARWSLAFGSGGLDAVATELATRGAEEARDLAGLASIVLADGEAKVWTAATYGLLHASWAHLLSNAVWLVAFGTPVARRLGPARFLGLTLAAVLAGAGAHFLADPYAVVPMIGASGGVSGLVAAAAWFVFTPVPPWIPLEPHERPRQTLRAIAGNPRVLGFLGVWLAVDIAVGLLAGPLGIAGGAIAWQAHIGGLLAGLALFPLLDPLRDAVGVPDRDEADRG